MALSVFDLSKNAFNGSLSLADILAASQAYGDMILTVGLTAGVILSQSQSSFKARYTAFKHLLSVLKEDIKKKPSLFDVTLKDCMLAGNIEAMRILFSEFPELMKTAEAHIVDANDKLNAAIARKAEGRGTITAVVQAQQNHKSLSDSMRNYLLQLSTERFRSSRGVPLHTYQQPSSQPSMAR